MHNSRPKWCGGLYRKSITHRSSIGISHPDGDGVLFVESNGPSISKAAAGAGLRGYSFVEGKRGRGPKALGAGFVVAKMSHHNSGRGSDPTARNRKKFG